MDSRSSVTHILSQFCAQLIRIEWLLLLLVMPVVLFSAEQGVLALALLPSLWLARKIATGRFVEPTPLDLSVLLLAVMALVSGFITPDLSLTLPKVSALIFGIGLFYAVNAATGEAASNLRRGVLLFLVGGTAVAGIGLLSADWQAKVPYLSAIIRFLPQQPIRIPGTAAGVHVNELAGVLLWFLPLGVTLAASCLVELRRGNRNAGLPVICAALWLMSMFLGGVLLLTQSRSAWLAFAFTLFLLTLFALRRRLWLAGLLALLFILANLLLLSFEPERTLSLLVDPVSSGESLGTVTSTTTLESRQAIWQRAFYAVSDFPLTGMGMNSFRYLVPVLYPFTVDLAGADIAHAHNQLLQTAVDLGLPGLVAHLALLIGAGVILWQTWQQAADHWARALAAGFAASLLAFNLFGFTDAVALGARPGFFFWVLMGLIVGLFRLTTQPVKAGSATSSFRSPGGSRDEGA